MADAPAKLTIADRIAEVVLDHPPVNAFDSKGWHALADLFRGLSRERRSTSCCSRRPARAFAPASTSRSWRAIPSSSPR
jgi:enoyl-CoA hydratase